MSPLEERIWKWASRGGLSAAVALLFCILMGWIASPLLTGLKQIAYHIDGDARRDYWLSRVCANTAKTGDEMRACMAGWDIGGNQSHARSQF